MALLVFKMHGFSHAPQQDTKPRCSYTERDTLKDIKHQVGMSIIKTDKSLVLFCPDVYCVNSCKTQSSVLPQNETQTEMAAPQMVGLALPQP